MVNPEVCPKGWQKNLLTTGYVRASVMIHFTSIFIRLLNVLCLTTVILSIRSTKNIPDLIASCTERTSSRHFAYQYSLERDIVNFICTYLDQET